MNMGQQQNLVADRVCNPNKPATETLTLTPWKKKKMTIEDLPADIIQNILSRLPIDSLLENKQVGCLCYSLIKDSDHHLYKMHHTRLFENLNPSPTTSLIFVNGPYDSSRECCLLYLHDIDKHDKGIAGKTLPFQDLFEYGLTVVGSCNGFVCLADDLSLLEVHNWETIQEEEEEEEKEERHWAKVIFNPVNGDWIKLPPPPKSSKVPLERLRTFIGFGYTAKKREYKVVRMQFRLNQCSLKAQILTLGGNNTWRTIETTTTTYTPFLLFSAVHVNGVLYWANLRDETFDTIGTFNLEDETFGIVSLLSPIEDGYFSLGTLGGCLMIVDHYKEPQEVWLMKDCGGNQSWVLEFVIPLPLRFDNFHGMTNLRPLSIRRNGKLLLYYDDSLFSYDPVTRTHELVKIPGLPQDSFSTIPHVGTLVTCDDVFFIKE